MAAMCCNMRIARIARFAITNQSGRKIEVKLINLRNHVKESYLPTSVENGMSADLVITAQIYDSTSIQIRDLQGNYVRHVRFYKKFPYGKSEKIVVVPEMFRVDDGSAHVISSKLNFGG